MGKAPARAQSGGCGLARGAVRLGFALAMAFVLGPAAHAAAAGGDLELIDCISDDDSSVECATSTPGLGEHPQQVVISPDEASVYVASYDGSSVVTLDRDLETGELIPAGCIEDETHGGDECATTAPGLQSARSIQISPDGTSVYVGGRTSVAHFVRGEAGELSFVDCITSDAAQDCGDDFDPDLALGEVMLSPDGKSLYALSEHSLVAFDRAADGALAFAECYTASNVPDYPGGGPSPGTCTPSNDALFGATAFAISPDGESVYVLATGGGDGVGSDGITRFDRDPSTGEITGATCEWARGIVGCATPPYSLDPRSLALSPDGSSAYVTSGYMGHENALHRLDRDSATGALSRGECFTADPHALCVQSPILRDSEPRFAGMDPSGRSTYLTNGSVLDSPAETGQTRLFPLACAGPPALVAATGCPARELNFTADGATAFGARGVVSIWRRELDFEAPNTSIVLPGKRSPRVRFLLEATEPGSAFECSVDRQSWRACASRGRTRKLGPGKHRLRARAIDPAGNPDPQPAKRRFRIR